MNTNLKTPTFLSAYAVGTDARELANICVRELENVDADFNFGFIYASDALANQLPRLMTLLSEATNIQEWCGTLGTGICIDDLELYDQPAVSILLCQFNENAWHTIALDPKKGPLSQTDDNFDPCYGLMHADPGNPMVSGMISRAQALGKNMNVMGGLTLSQTQSLQIAGDRIHSGASGLLLDESQPILVDITQGCSPIGEYRQITEAKQNFVLELDGKPALRALRQDVGEVLGKDLTRLGGYIFAGIVKASVGAEEHDGYLIRDLIAVDENKQAFAIGENVNVGDKLVFCRRDGNTASNDLDEMLDRLKQKLNGAQPRGAIYYSCVNRGRQLFGTDSQELKRIRSVLGDIPLVGFFAAGEIYQGQMFTHSGVLTLFL